MRSDLLLVCIGGPLLAVLLLKGRARRVMAAVASGMLAAFLCGAISGFFATLVQYDTLAAVLYISPLVEEGMKLALFLMFLFVCQLRDEEVPEIAVGIGVGFSLMESGGGSAVAAAVCQSVLLCHDSRGVRADADALRKHDPPHAHGNRQRLPGRLCGNRNGTRTV